MSVLFIFEFLAADSSPSMSVTIALQYVHCVSITVQSSGIHPYIAQARRWVLLSITAMRRRVISKLGFDDGY
jgi:hypothetical protein